MGCAFSPCQKHSFASAFRDKDCVFHRCIIAAFSHVLSGDEDQKHRFFPLSVLKKHSFFHRHFCENTELYPSPLLKKYSFFDFSKYRRHSFMRFSFYRNARIFPFSTIRKHRRRSKKAGISRLFSPCADHRRPDPSACEMRVEPEWKKQKTRKKSEGKSSNKRLIPPYVLTFTSTVSRGR